MFVFAFLPARLCHHSEDAAYTSYRYTHCCVSNDYYSYNALSIMYLPHKANMELITLTRKLDGFTQVRTNMCVFAVFVLVVSCFRGLLLTHFEKSTIFCSGEAGFFSITFGQK